MGYFKFHFSFFPGSRYIKRVILRKNKSYKKIKKRILKDWEKNIQNWEKNQTLQNNITVKGCGSITVAGYLLF